MREVHPLGLVPYHIIMNALAYQVQYTLDSFFAATVTKDQNRVKPSSQNFSDTISANQFCKYDKLLHMS